MKDNFLKLGILGGRDVPFDTSLFSYIFFLIKHVSRSVYHGNGWKKNEILLPNSYFSI